MWIEVMPLSTVIAGKNVTLKRRKEEMNEKMANKYICVNLDKEEYIEVGELPASSIKNTKTMRTIDYLLASDWSGCKLVFAFEGMDYNEDSPSATESLYEYAVNCYDERTVLNRVPDYRYILNLSKEEYYDKECIPLGDDNTFFDPLSLLTLSVGKDEMMSVKTNKTEKEEVGIWSLDRISATNNLSLYPDFKKILPSFRCELLADTLKLSGLNIVVTGRLSGMDRYDAEQFIRENGGNPQPTVTKKTDFLVVGASPGTSKMTKARNYGIKQISEEEFFDMVK